MFLLLRDASMAAARRRAVAPPPAPVLELAALDARGVRDAVRDPSIRAIARAMPTRLVAPEPLDDVRAEDAAPGWGLVASGVSASPCTGAGVRVALLDTGIDRAHPAFLGVALTCRDFAGTGIDDANGHGTHCAGIVLGREVDGARIGVAPGGTDALIGKVLADDGRGRSEGLLRGLLWAAESGAHVVALAARLDTAGLAEELAAEGWPMGLAVSVALESHRMTLRLLHELLAMLGQLAADPVICAPAGNDSRRTIAPEFEVSVPDALTGVISVGALGQGASGLAPAPFSNAAPVMVAPGVNVVSAAAGGGLRPLNGTTMACAHVAGLAALWCEARRPGAAAAGAALMASCRTDGLDPRFADRFDCGLGMPRAPARSEPLSRAGRRRGSAGR
ncbi:MAG: peptidase S8 [Rhodobacteraceae bacterium]|nr:peptidase S8 [Paracoccaceae bacterium]